MSERSAADRVVVEPPLAPERVERQWAGIARRLDGRRRPPLWPRATLLAAALAVVVALLVWLRPARTTSIEGTALESAGAGQVLKLPDGTEVALSAATKLRFATWNEQRVVTELDHGEMTLDVRHIEGRSWIVSLGAFDVRVVGTRFTVRRDVDPERISVSVERGRVEVTRRDEPKQVRVLGAGESWSVAAPIATSTPASLDGQATDPRPVDASSEVAPADDAPSAEPSASSDATAAAPPSWEDLARGRRFKEAYDALGPDDVAAVVDRGSAEKLFRLAEVARASGHLRDAERAFDALRRRHRGDARAGLAAFELGRLRLDSLGNPGGAVEAFADAIALAPGAPFREDAEARRVQALERSGARGACEQARDAYLQRYPGGAHAAVVRARCSAR